MNNIILNNLLYYTEIILHYIEVILQRLRSQTHAALNLSTLFAINLMMAIF